MTIRTKIISVVGVTLVFGCLVVGWLFHDNYKRSLDSTAEATTRASHEAFENLRKANTDLLTASVQALLTHERINEAFAARDRDRLRATSEPLYQTYQQRFGITHWNYWEPEPTGSTKVKGLVNFFRTATPTVHSDMLDRATLARVVETKTYVDGLELGNTGFALRVVHPVHHEGKLIGYFEMGRDIGSFLESMKRQTGSDCGMMLLKSKLNEQKWASSRKSRGLGNNWGDMTDVVLAKATSNNDKLFEYASSLETISEQGTRLGFVHSGGQVFVRSAFALRDSGGEKVGAVFILTDVTGMYASAQRAQLQGIVAVVGLMVLLGLALCVMFHRLIVVRLDHLIAVATRVVGGEFTLSIKATSDDEIGRFESLFEQFRAIFVGVVQELESKEAGTPSATLPTTPPPKRGQATPPLS